MFPRTMPSPERLAIHMLDTTPRWRRSRRPGRVLAHVFAVASGVWFVSLVVLWLTER